MRSWTYSPQVLSTLTLSVRSLHIEDHSIPRSDQKQSLYAESVEVASDSIFSPITRSPSPESHPTDTVDRIDSPICHSPESKTPYRLQIRLRVSPPKTKILLRISNERKRIVDVSQREEALLKRSRGSKKNQHGSKKKRRKGRT
jgi:hypothetical protein